MTRLYSQNHVPSCSYYHPSADKLDDEHPSTIDVSNSHRTIGTRKAFIQLSLKPHTFCFDANSCFRLTSPTKVAS